MPTAAVALGAHVIEKHLCLSRAEGGVDSAFSLEPLEFRELVISARTAFHSLGEVSYGPTPGEGKGRDYRRSLYAVQDIAAGEAFTPDNVRSIRPGLGLPPKHIEQVLLGRASRAIQRGEPLSWLLVNSTHTR